MTGSLLFGLGVNSFFSEVKTLKDYSAFMGEVGPDSSTSIVPHGWVVWEPEKLLASQLRRGTKYNLAPMSNIPAAPMSSADIQRPSSPKGP
jgi:hypothetical protein